jgi:alpha-tubulin suppressor-like RCC1 family protein
VRTAMVLLGVCLLACAVQTELAIADPASVVGWGWNGAGQCDAPPPNTDFVTVAAGYEQSGGVRADGSIAAWGDNEYGQCEVPTPNTAFTAVAGDMLFSLGLKSEGSVVVWGSDGLGQYRW